MDILFLILLLPLVSALILFVSPLNVKVLNLLHILCSAAVSLALLCSISKVLSLGAIYAFNDMLFLDSLGAVFFSTYKFDWILCKFILD